MRHSLNEINQIRLKLNIANMFLLVAALVQLLFFLPTSKDPSVHQKVFDFMVMVSAGCGGIGFFIAYRQLDLKGESAENPGMARFVGPNLKGGAVFFFFLAFLVPLLNLIIIVWAYAKSKSAIRVLDNLRAEEIKRRKDERQVRK